MHTAEGPIGELVGQGNESRLRAYLAKMTADERLVAVLVCRPDGTTLAKTERAPKAISCEEHGNAKSFSGRVVQLPSGSVQVSRFDFDAAQPIPYRVVLLSDLSFADSRQRTARDFILVFVGISVLLLALLVVLVAWLQLRRLVDILIGDIRGKRFLDNAKSPRSSQPILSQVRQVLAEAEEKQRLEIDFRENWTPQALRQVVRDHLHSSQVIIVPSSRSRRAAWSRRWSRSCERAREPGSRTAPALRTRTPWIGSITSVFRRTIRRIPSGACG
jgi:trehalose 6-phosphate synthase